MFKLIFILISVFVGCESAKILGVFPTPSISHQVVFRPLMLELAKRGHEVTVITTDPAFPNGQTPQNLTEIDVHDISYEHWNKFIEEKATCFTDLIDFTISVSDLLYSVVEIQIKSAEVQKFLRENNEFDLIFVESYIRAGLIYSHIFNAPVIEFSSLSGFNLAFETIGGATHPLIYPNPLHRKIYNLTLWEKIKKLYLYYRTEYIIAQHVHVENEGFKKILGLNTVDLDDLRRNVRMLFLSVHPVWDFNRPVPPNVVYLGSLHQKPPRDLPEDIKSYLDSSKNGVIYVSFGTNVKPSMFPADKLKILTDVFSRLSYDVLWKWDKDELPGRPQNVRISKWWPQSDLLRHPKVKLFIMQGGLQSTDEALTAGVPLIGMPMLGDQWFNVDQYVKFGIGKGLSIETLTEEQLMDAIKTVIEDESYRQNVIKLRNIMHDHPQPPLERAVWWTEHVLRHSGGAHLRTPGANVHWTEYYVLDVVLVLFAALVLFLAAAVIVIRFIIFNIKYYMRNKIKVN